MYLGILSSKFFSGISLLELGKLKRRNDRNSLANSVTHNDLLRTYVLLKCDRSLHNHKVISGANGY